MTRDTDPQALRGASTAWREMGRQLEDMVQTLHKGVRDARESHWQGAAAEAFDEDWSRLRQVVDEALPIFRMAASELDSAAATMDGSDVPTRLDSAGTTSSGSGSADSYGVATASSSDSSSDSSSGSSEASDLRGGGGYQAVFAVSALSQLGVMLGSTFGKRDGAGQRGGSRLARSAPQPESTLPRSADPFASGTTAPVDDRQSGGLGIARGRRQPARNGELADGTQRPPGATGSGPLDTGQSPERPSPLDGGALGGERPDRGDGVPESGEHRAAAARFGGPEPEPAADRPQEPSPLDQPIGRNGAKADGPADPAGANRGSGAAPETGAPHTSAEDPQADATRTASATPVAVGEVASAPPGVTGERPTGKDRDAGERSENTSAAPAASTDAPRPAPEAGSPSGKPADPTPGTELPEDPGARLEKASGVERETRTEPTGRTGKDAVDVRQQTGEQTARPGTAG